MNIFKSLRRFSNCTVKFFVLHLLLSFCFAQWVDFSLAQEEFSQPDVQRFLEGAAFTLSESPSNLISPNHRMHVSIGFSKHLWSHASIYQSQISRVAPKFLVSFFLTNNLTFIGGVSQFRSANQNIQIQNYGLALRANEDTSYPLQTSVIFYRLEGPKDLSQRTVSLNLSSKINILNSNLQIGIGKEMYSATFLINDNSFPSGMKGEINYLLLGMLIKNNTYEIIPQLRFHPNLIDITLKFSLGVQ